MDSVLYSADPGAAQCSCRSPRAGAVRPGGSGADRAVFRAETGLPLYPDYTLDKDLLVWAEEYEASTGTPVVMYDLRTVLEGADQLEAWVTAFEAGEPAELLLLGSSHGLASNRYTFLLYDGGDSYTCLDAHAGTSLTETAVWKNRVGWEIAGVVPLIREPVSPGPPVPAGRTL